MRAHVCTKCPHRGQKTTSGISLSLLPCLKHSLLLAFSYARLAGMAVSRDSFVSAFSFFFRNAVGTLGSQICTTVPSFMWTLEGSDSGSCACVVDALLA